MPVCSFCKKGYEFPRGTTVVQKDASVRYFCSSKCRKNSEMGRVSKKVAWIRKSEVIKGEKAKKEASYLVRQEVLKVAEEAKAAKKTKKSKK